MSILATSDPRLEKLLEDFKPSMGTERGSGKRVPVYSNGGVFWTINKTIGKKLEGLRDGSLTIEEDDFKLFFYDITRYASGFIPERWFEKSLSTPKNGDEDKFNKLFDDLGDKVVFSLFSSNLKFWETNGNNQIVAEQPVSIDFDKRKKIDEKILKLASDGKLEEITTEVIGEILGEYTLSHYNSQIGDLITNKIKDTTADTRIEVTSKVYEKYFDLKTGEEFVDGKPVATLTQNIYSSGEERPKIPLDSFKGGQDDLLLLYFKKEALQFYPGNLIRDPNGEVIESVKKELEDFNSLEGKNVSTYKFKFVLDFDNLKTFFNIDLERNVSDNFLNFYKWVSQTQTTNAFPSHDPESESCISPNFSISTVISFKKEI